MRIGEISGKLNEVYRPPLEEADYILRNAGFRMVGSGFHATVYRRNDEPWVVKLVANQDMAYRKFIQFCKTHQSPHLPVFRGSLVRVTDYYSVVRIEALESLPYDKSITDDVFYMSNLLRFYNGENAFLPPDAKQWANDHPSVNNILCALGKALADYCEDICLSNVMRRGDTYVLIDPVS